MVNIKELKNKQQDLIANLTEEELKEYILYLTSCYYESYKANDVQQFNNNLELLEEVIEKHKDKYVNIVGFIYFSLFFNANLYIHETASEDKDIKLTIPFNYNLYESEEETEELTHNIRNILNKERIRIRYNEKRTNKAAE